MSSIPSPSRSATAGDDVVIRLSVRMGKTVVKLGFSVGVEAASSRQLASARSEAVARLAVLNAII
jgi:hypothetical protein